MFSEVSTIRSAAGQIRLRGKTYVATLTLFALIGLLIPPSLVQAKPVAQLPNNSDSTVPGQAPNRYLANKIGEFADLTIADHHHVQESQGGQAAGMVMNPSVISDEFNGANLRTEQWTLVNPLNDGWVTLTDGQLQLSVPHGPSHDPWNFNRALRVMQAVGDTPLALEAKFTSMPTIAYQMQGLVLEQDADNWLRFEVQHDGQSLQVVVIATVNGVSTVQGVSPVSATAASWLRVNRQGNDWQLTYSGDGVTWLTAATFNWAFTLTAVGPYVANHAEEEAAPAFTAQVDYLRNLNAGAAAGGNAEVDMQAPLIHSVQAFAQGEALTIRWRTDEPSLGVVEYGPTSTYGANAQSDGVGYNHQVILQGLTANQRYHYRIGATDSNTNRVDSADSMVQFTPTDAVGPTIVLWYGNQQSFGQNGRPQVWLNLLGNVADPDGVVWLRYTLNGATTSSRLTIGPDNRRLANNGDFAVDIAATNLQVGNNTVVLTAKDTLDNTSMQTVTVNYQPAAIQPSYTIDWSSLNNDAQIQTVAHSIDGKWRLENNMVRTAEPGYDRMLGLGDISWNDYEILAPITIHDLPASTKNGLGVILRWNGHTNYPVYCKQPKCGWLPLGVIAWWFDKNLQLYVDGKTILASAPFTLAEGKTYWLKAQVTTNPNGGLYSMKMWEDGQTEPAAWSITGQSSLSQPQRGAPSFVIHRADASLGNVTVTPVGLSNPPRNFPPVANNDTVNIAPGRTVYINVLKNDTDAGGLLDPSSVRIEQQPQHGTVTVNTLTGQISYKHDGSATTQDSFTYTVRDDGNGRGSNILRSNTATVSVTVTPSAPSVVLSDDFNRCLLNSAWEFINPLGEGSYEIVGAGSGNAQITLSLPDGTKHDAWGTGQNEAIRLMQPVENSDFEVEASFTVEPTGNTNDQGILVEQDENNFVRFDVFHNGSALRAFVGTTINGFNLQIASTIIPATTGLKLKLNRTANTWTMSNWDGTKWNQIANFNQVLVVNRAGFYAANAGGKAFTTSLDYFFDSAAPINPEDPIQPNTLTVGVTGNGSVSANPPLQNYACGTTVELTAQPAAGFKFASWSGALTGNVNPNSLIIEGSTIVTATFVAENVDVTPPVITLNPPNPLEVTVGGTFTEPGYSAQDDVDGDITGQVVVSGTVDTTQPGNYTITYDVTDSSGNVAAQQQRIVIVNLNDTTAPVITLTGATTLQVEAGTPWTEPGYSAQDNVDGNLTSQVQVRVLGGGAINTSRPATFIITYDVADASGNEAAQVRRVVNVVDTTPPVITLNGNNPLQLTVGATYTDPGATATDSVDGDLISRIVVGGDVVNTATARTYVVTYNVSDLSGNKAVQKTRTVNVIATAPTSFKVFMPLVKK